MEHLHRFSFKLVVQRRFEISQNTATNALKIFVKRGCNLRSCMD